MRRANFAHEGRARPRRADAGQVGADAPSLAGHAMAVLALLGEQLRAVRDVADGRRFGGGATAPIFRR